MEKEIWKDIPGYEGIYMVSNKARVKSIDHKLNYIDGRNIIKKGRVLKTQVSRKGYIMCSLSKRAVRFNTSVHRLLAIAFIPNPLNLPQVNHKNGIKDDNRIENLEWCDNRHNINHAYKNNLIKVNHGQDHHNSKLTNNQVRECRRLHKKEGFTNLELSKKYKVTPTAMSNILRKITYINI